MGVQHLCWEGCSWTSRHTGQVLATDFCSLCPQLALYHKAQVLRATPVLFISVFCSSMEIPVLTLFQTCRLEVPGKYKLLSSKSQDLFHSTKRSICFCVMKTRHQLAMLHKSQKNSAAHSAIGLAVSEWLGQFQNRDPCPECQKTLFSMLLFVSDLRCRGTRHNSWDLSHSLTALPHSGFRRLPGGHRAAAEEWETRGWP